MNCLKVLLALFIAAITIFSVFKFGGKSTSAEISKKDLYGTVDRFKYLTGRFNPAKVSSFVNLAKTSVPTDKRAHYLRKETVAALSKMIKAFNKEYPNIKIFVLSSTRNFYYQKHIWERKFNGKRMVDGKNLAKAVENKLERAKIILKYSSMPGTSRHHWGSDFDINSLENSYFEKGKGKIIYKWLSKNASKYGFAQPYTAGRKAGYEEEKWHWSYIPLAKPFLMDWVDIYNNDKSRFNKKGLFAGSAAAGHLAPIYVTEIADSCK